MSLLICVKLYYRINSFKLLNGDLTGFCALSHNINMFFINRSTTATIYLNMKTAKREIKVKKLMLDVDKCDKTNHVGVADCMTT